MNPETNRPEGHRLAAAERLLADITLHVYEQVRLDDSLTRVQRQTVVSVVNQLSALYVEAADDLYRFEQDQGNEPGPSSTQRTEHD